MIDRTPDGDPSGISMATETLPEATVVTVAGEFDLLAAGPVRSTLDELLVSGVSALVVDLAELTFIDSIGVGVLVRTHKKAWLLRTPFLLVCPEGSAAHRILSLTGVLVALRVRGSQDEALAALAA